MEKTVIFPGSFDPFTLGHEDIVCRALKLFDKVIVAIGINAEKNSLYDTDDRIRSIKACFEDNPKVEVISYTGLTVDLCKTLGVFTLLRGVRDSSDWDYESRISQINRTLDDRVETVFLQTRAEFSAISSSVVRDIMKHGGDVSMFLPGSICK